MVDQIEKYVNFTKGTNYRWQNREEDPKFIRIFRHRFNFNGHS